MRITALFFLYLLFCLILAALLAVPLVETGWIGDFAPQRVMSRLAQVFILLGFWPFLLWMKLADRTSLGYGIRGDALRQSLLYGWLAGVLILLFLVSALLLLEIRVPDADLELWPFLVKKAVQALIGGLLIGILEETFFRGALYTGIRRHGGIRSAVVWSALLYAMVHFLKPRPLPPDIPFDWAGAWQMFSAVFTDSLQWVHLDSFSALFMVGVFLALVRERTGHIGWCIGLHAGWVFVIQTNRRATDLNPDGPFAFLVGNYDGTIGWLAAAWIALLAALYWKVTAATHSPKRAGSGAG